jgi:hypothetical protein
MTLGVNVDYLLKQYQLIDFRNGEVSCFFLKYELNS